MNRSMYYFSLSLTSQKDDKLEVHSPDGVFTEIRIVSSLILTSQAESGTSIINKQIESISLFLVVS